MSSVLVRSFGVMMIGWAVILAGCASEPAASPSQGEAPSGYFADPRQAVERAAELMRAERWGELAEYYDWSGVSMDPQELRSGRFFINTQRPADAHPAGFWKYRHPFPPSFKFMHTEPTGDDQVIRVVVGVEIDQGGGPPQRAFQHFLLRRSDKGYKILPPASSPRAQLPEGYEPKLGIDTIVDLRPSLAGAVGRLPPAEVKAIVALLTQLRAFQDGTGLPATLPPPTGRRGGAIPGMPAEAVYDPTDQELLISEVGTRIEWILEHHHPAQVVEQLNASRWTANSYEYHRIDVQHVDVIGSGRYFYAEKPVAKKVMLPRKMTGF